MNAPDFARHIMDALDLPADVPETRHEQAQITGAIERWPAPPDFEPVEPRTLEAPRRVRVYGRCVDENRDERGDYVEIELPDG